MQKKESEGTASRTAADETDKLSHGIERSPVSTGLWGTGAGSSHRLAAGQAR